MTTLELIHDTHETSALASRSLWRIYWLEAKYEFLKLWRMPGYSIPTLVFPVLFYVLFGLTFRYGSGGPHMATYLLVTYGCFGIFSTALFGFGVGVATERGQGWLQLKRASPMPAGAYFAAKIAMCLLFGGIIVAMLSILGVCFGGVSLTAGAWVGLFATLIVGALPLCAFGLLLGFVAGPNSAVGVVNIIYLPMAFISGLWIPVVILPDFFKVAARCMPAYHYSQLALKTVGADLGEPVWTHALYLVLFTLVSLTVATLAFRRDEARAYG